MTDDLPQKKNIPPEDEPGPNMHFQRPDGRYIDYEPDERLLEVLPHLEEDVLEGLGLQPWSDDKEIWLFPVEWYEHIPEGFEIVTILGEVKEFDPAEDSKEARRGAMPFGIARPGYEPDESERALNIADE